MPLTQISDVLISYHRIQYIIHFCGLMIDSYNHTAIHMKFSKHFQFEILIYLMHVLYTQLYQLHIINFFGPLFVRTSNLIGMKAIQEDVAIKRFFERYEHLVFREKDNGLPDGVSKNSLSFLFKLVHLYFILLHVFMNIYYNCYYLKKQQQQHTFLQCNDALQS